MYLFTITFRKTVVCIRETTVVSEHANVIIICIYLCALLSDGM